MRHPSVLAPALVLASCTVDLAVDRSAQINCHSDAECPSTFRCKADLGRCVVRTTNESPTLALEPVARQVSPVGLAVTVIDAESDPVTISGEVSVAGGPFAAITLPATALPSSPSGAAATLTWDAAAALGAGVHEHVVVRLTPNDGTTSGAAITSQPFVVGNEAPVITGVEVVTNGGVAAGRVDLRITVADSTSDLCTFTALELSLAGDFGDAVALDATSLPGVVASDLETSPTGVTHTFTWDTGAQAPVRRPSARVRARVRDDFDPSAVVASDPFAIDNAPSLVAAVPAPAGGGRFLTSVAIPLTARDPNGDAVSVQVEYSVDGVSFATATTVDATALAASAAGVDHTVTWSALTDAGATLPARNVDAQGGGVADTPVLAFTPAVTLRLTPTDATGLAGTSVTLAPMALGNDAPAATLNALPSVVAGQVPIGVTLTDAGADAADLEVAFSTNAGVTWRAAALALGATRDLATDGAGRLHVVVWDSAAPALGDPTQPQGVGATRATVQLRVRASDTPASQVQHFGAWSVFGTTVRNQTPPAIIGLDARRAATLAGRSPVTITYRVSDEESDPVDVRVLYSADGGRSFTPCDEYPSRVSEGLYDLATAPIAGGPGLLHTFVWDPGALLEMPATVTIRVEATDGYDPTPSTANVLVGDALEGDVTTLAGSAFNVVSLGLTYPTGSFPWSFVADDFDGDGRVDVAVLNDLAPVSVLVYQGLAGSAFANVGSFSPFAQYLAAGTTVTNSEPRLTQADVDGDGVRDLVVTGNTGVGWLRNLGNGSFTAFTSLLPATGGWSGYGCVVDVTGDGKPDLVLSQGDLNNHGPGSLGVFAGTGGGAFAAAPVITAVPRTPRRCLPADLDHDGATELVTDGGGYFLLYRGDATGALSAAGRIDVYGDIQATIVADVNGDGVDDLVFPKPVQTSVGVVLGDPSRSYRLVAATTGTNAWSVAVVDVDGDDAPDVVTDIIEVLRQTSTPGVFAGGSPLGVAAYGIAARPATGGQPPIALGLQYPLAVVALTPAKQSATSHFHAVNALSASQNTFSVVAFDATFDGRVDLVAGSVFDVGLFQAGGSAAAGDGSFAAVTFPVNPDYLSQLVSADVDGDGLTDLVIPGSISELSVALGRLPGTAGYPFEPRVGHYASSDSNAGESRAALGDLDGDGVSEILYAWPSATGHGELYVAHVGATALTLAAPVTIPQPSGIAVGDLNGDGRLDVLIRADSSGSLVPLLNDGTGALVTGTPLAMSLSCGETCGFALDDLDDDGDLDAVTSSGDGIRVALGNGDGTFTAGQTITPAPGTGFTDLSLGDLDADGVVDLVVTGSTGISVGLGVTSGGVATGTFAPLVLVVPSGTELWHSPLLADLNGDGLPDLAATTLSGPRFSLAEQDAFFAAATRGLSASKRTGAQLLAPGLVPRPGLDRFGTGYRPPRVVFEVVRDDRDLRARVRRFLGTDKRRFAIGPPLRVEGDLAFVRTHGASSGSAARIAPTARLGLDLTNASRGVVVPLPVYAGRSGLDLAAGKVIVVRETASYQTTSGYLPQATTASGIVDEVIPTRTLTTITRGASLTTGTGSRFIVVTGAQPEVQVLTDRLGVFQAYFEP